MRLIPLHTGIIKEGDDLAQIIVDAQKPEPGDIIVVSAKVVAVAEGAIVDLSQIVPSPSAEEWTKRVPHHKDPRFRQAVIDETKRMHGRIFSECSNVMLAELQPSGFPHGCILAANAGLDASNIQSGYVVGWPHDPVASVAKLRHDLEHYMFPVKRLRVFWFSGFLVSRIKKYAYREKTNLQTCKPANQKQSVAVILSDSCCKPRRWGVTAYALVVSGMDPIVSQIGRKDLFGRELQMTKEAVADQLATAANFLMGNADQAIPAVIIREHGLPFSDFEGWVPGIEPEEDLFGAAIGNLAI